MRFRSIASLVALATLLTMLLALSGSGRASPQGQSPVSPLSALPWMPTPEPTSTLERLLERSFWMSFPPWIVVGLALFGALARVLVYTLRLLEHEDRPTSPLSE